MMKATSLLLITIIAAAQALAQPAIKAKRAPAAQKPAAVVNNNIQPGLYNDLLKSFKEPPEAAKPWVFWYWIKAGVSREGITADLKAMKDAGIGGAYLMPIQGLTTPPLM